MANNLSPREQEVAKLRASGMTVEEISAKLSSPDPEKPCSPATVRVHLQRIYRHLGIGGPRAHVQLILHPELLDGPEPAQKRKQRAKE